MAALVGLAVPLVLVLFVATALMRSSRKSGTSLKAHGVSWLRGYRFRDDGVGPGTIALAALAASAATDLLPSGEDGLVPVVVVALAAGIVRRKTREVVLDLLGAAAAVATVVKLFTEPLCGDVAMPLLVTGVVLIGLVLAATTAASFLRVAALRGRGGGRFKGLVAFGLLEVLAFAVAPVGVVLAGGEVVRWGAALALVVAVGLLAGVSASLAVELMGIGLLVVDLWLGAALPDAGCGDPANWGQLAAFVVVYLVVRAVADRFHR